MLVLRVKQFCPPRPSHESHWISTLYVHHKQGIHRHRFICTSAQTGSNTTGDTDQSKGTAASISGAPDFWSTPSASLSIAPSTADVTSSANDPDFLTKSPAAGDVDVLPSPWDDGTTFSSTAALRTANLASITEATPSTNSSGTNDSAAAAGVAPVATAAAVDAAAAAEIKAAAESNTSSSSSSSGKEGGGGRSSSGGVPSGTVSRKEVSGGTSSGTAAGLSEDTAMLLARLRAELARTSNMPLPQRQSSSSSSAATGISTKGSSSGGSSSNGVTGGLDSESLGSGSPGSSKSAVASTGPTTVMDAAAAASAPKPPGTSAMSAEALAAALVASGAAVPDSLAATAAGAAATTAPVGGGGGGFFDRLFRGPQKQTPGAAAAAVNSTPSSAAVFATATAATDIGPSSGSSSSRKIAVDGGFGGGGNGHKRRAVVVGGGIGGLVAAARLAREGFTVTLLEANSQVGGRCQSIHRGRFRFDTGPSLMLFLETYRRTFAALGTSLAQQIPVVRVAPAAYRVFFQGAGSLDLLYDIQRMVEQLEGVEKGAGRQYLDWLATARAALELGIEGFIRRDADTIPELLTTALKDAELRSLLASVGVNELLGSHHSRMSRRFKDPRLRALFTFQDLYVGLTPYNAPGVYSLLAATELTDGVWYPLGGFGQIRDALLRVGQGLGVRLRCGARVAGIRTAPGEAGAQRVMGVTLGSGEELDADVVVSNRDVPLTYELLRGPAETHGAAQARRLLAQEYSAGVISFNWSVKKKLDQLLHHNVFLSGDYEGSWVRATSADTLSRSPNFYVHCPSRTDPTACPSGSDSVMVLLPVANMQEVMKAQEAERRRAGPLGSLPGPIGQRAAGLAAAAAAVTASSGGGGPAASEAAAAAAATAADYSSLVVAGREAVLRSMAEAGFADVRQHIVDEQVIDPLEWRDRYSLAHGAAFGLSHGLSQLSVFRPGLSDKQIRGLYFVGASSRPGNGVPLTMIGADLVAQRVLKDVAAGVI